MSYYTRILTPCEKTITADQLNEIVQQQSLKASITTEAGKSDNWTEIVLFHKTGPEIAAIERTVIEKNNLGARELAEFLDEIKECKPESAVKWLADYLPRTEVIYAFQWLSGTRVKNGSAILGTLMVEMHKRIGGVIQTDGEGFSDDEQGDHILWQFSDDVEGPWNMAVLQEGKWLRFRMQLGNLKHRNAFLRGEVPAGVKFQ